nr:hypothetical protein CFP56_13347 [Quercus suber]
MNLCPYVLSPNTRLAVSHTKSFFYILSIISKPAIHSLITRAEMVVSFLDIPGEVRNMIYELVLLHDEPLHCGYTWDRVQQKELGINLLLANKTVRHEAAPIFFGRNCFEVMELAPCAFDSVLCKIHPRLAHQIQHARTTFMIFCSEDHHRDFLLADVLDRIAGRCPNVRTITVLLENDHRDRWWRYPSWGVRLFRDKLAAVNAALSRFTKLGKVIVEVPRDVLKDRMQRELQKYAWDLKIVEAVQEGVTEADFEVRDSCECDRYDHDT